jgi:3-hydroxyacyl-[acyl-carrier-protein] dehydratase
VVQGVILCEIMAQTCCALIGNMASTEGKTPYFTGIDGARFKSPCRPGDRLDITCRIN